MRGTEGDLQNLNSPSGIRRGEQEREIERERGARITSGGALFASGALASFLRDKTKHRLRVY